VFKRQTSGSVICASCGVLVGVNDETCYNCGRRNPSLWGFAPALRALGTDLGFVPFVIGACAVLYGLTLVFSAGIGERSAVIRARICEGLGFLGIELDDPRNGAQAPVISTDSSRVTVRVIPTDEELMIARSVSRVLGLGAASKEHES